METKRMKLVFFDMDGTAVRYTNSSFHSSWDALGLAVGVGEEWDRLLNYYISKPDLYEEWFDKNCRFLTGLSVAPVIKKIFPPPYAPGFLDFCSYLKDNEVSTGIISGGISLVAERIETEANLDFIIANDLHVKDGKFTGTGTNRVSLSGKGEFVKSKLEEYKVKKEEAVFFGDHLNDIPAWKEVGLPIGMNLKDKSCYKFVQKHFKDFHEALTYFKKEGLLCQH
ncbi:MAG: HAD family phosphatase [Nanoarchaeota archaeon]|nr:HAD family phosphatase [Nanoarchaeota archaeon]MBU1643811.1 HAD family phosphatase [Nanoarchaeota archaeon]MBU1977480.1 HAD family phosphatase [Nanoarchaeota archaeon]